MRMVIVMLTVVLMGSIALAQTPFKRRAQTAPSSQVRPEIDLEVEPSVSPTEELDVNEFQLKRKELEHQVVKLEFDRVIDLKQSGNGYTARVTFESGRITEGLTLMIPEEGLDMFKDMAERAPRSPLRKKVYVEVLSGNVSRAVGVRYSKSKAEGERYSW